MDNDDEVDSDYTGEPEYIYDVTGDEDNDVYYLEDDNERRERDSYLAGVKSSGSFEGPSSMIDT
jgi:hypothetical protein